VKKLAAEAGVSPGQLALAWVMAQGDDVVPIPGTKRRKYLEENAGAADVALATKLLQDLEKEFPPDAAVGGRYAPGGMSMVNI
jgi:aryl-alcohol dehydrogenase-like predicted oxidoreductase